MPVDAISGRIYRESAIPGLTDTGTLPAAPPDPSGTKQFPSLSPSQSISNAKAAGAKAAGTGSTDPLTGVAGGALGKTAFLQLLVQEMTNQDPLKPADNTQFIAQLAQFSTLEQMQNMNDGFKNLSNTFQGSQARGLLGFTVKAVSSSSGQVVNGVVDQVLFNADGTVQVDVNGTAVNVSDITSVSPPPAPSSTTGSGSPPPASPTASAPLPGTLVPPTTSTTPATGTSGQ